MKPTAVVALIIAVSIWLTLSWALETLMAR